MDSSALQPGATVVAAVIAVSAPLVFASLGNRSGRRRTAELELLTKLADLRPGLGDELSRAKIDTLTADYLDDVQIGLRDEARASTRLMLVMLLAWAASLALQTASSLVTDPDLSGGLRQVLWGAYAVQLLATVAIVMATVHAWRTFRGWRRIGRQAERRAKILELKADTRLARIRDLNQELRDERRALTADIEHAKSSGSRSNTKRTLWGRSSRKSIRKSITARRQRVTCCRSPATCSPRQTGKPSIWLSVLPTPKDRKTMHPCERAASLRRRTPPGGGGSACHHVDVGRPMTASSASMPCGRRRMQNRSGSHHAAVIPRNHLEAPMNEYGRRAMAFWRERLPDELSTMPSPEDYFSTLGQEIEAKIDRLAIALAGSDSPGRNAWRRSAG